MNILPYFHRFLFSIIIAAPFYNLMKKSAQKYYIIAAVLIILNLIFTRISKRAERSLLLRPVSFKERTELMKKFKASRKTGRQASTSTSGEKRLEELKRLYERNLISDEEYREKKKEIINGL